MLSLRLGEGLVAAALVFGASVNAGQAPVDEFERTFKVARSLPCDVPLGSHPGMFNLEEKHARLGKGGSNPYIDPDGYKLEVDIAEAMFRAVLAEQQKTAGQ